MNNASLDDAGKRAPDGLLPCEVLSDLMDYFGNRLRRILLRRGDPIAPGDQFPALEIDRRTLDSRSADINSKYLNGRPPIPLMSGPVETRQAARPRAAASVFLRSSAIVMGPTPPGTGVM